VLMRQGRILIATFHPELTGDSFVHEYFLRLAGEGIIAPAKNDLLSALTGSGKGLWSAKHGDDDVRRLRES